MGLRPSAARFPDDGHIEHDPLKDHILESGLTTLSMGDSAVLIDDPAITGPDPVRSRRDGGPAFFEDWPLASGITMQT